MRKTVVPRLIWALAAPAVLGLAAGCSTSTPKASPSSGAPSTSAGVAQSPPASATHVFGPAGYGPLQLGQSIAAAQATGLLENAQPERDSASHCSSVRLLGPGGVVPANDDEAGRAYFADGAGLVAIIAAPGMSTPEGIKIGSTYEEVHRAYPAWQGGPDPENRAAHRGRDGVPVAASSKVSYIISVGNDGKVGSLILQGSNGGCFG